MTYQQVEIFTKSGCMDCKAAKEFLDQQGVSFLERNVTADPSAKKELQEKHQSQSTPTIVIDGRAIIGFSDQQRRLIERLLGEPAIPMAGQKPVGAGKQR